MTDGSPKRRRMWLGDGSCVRTRAEYENHVCSYDFVVDRTWNRRPFRALTVIDESTRECLAIVVERKLSSEDVMKCLEGLFTIRGSPKYLRSDNGSEFTAKSIREWLQRLHFGTLYSEPGSSSERSVVQESPGRSLASD